MFVLNKSWPFLPESYEQTFAPPSSSGRRNTPETFAFYYNTAIFQLIRFLKVQILKMFTSYHVIMFAVLLIGFTGVVFQASSGKESLANNPIQVKSADSKFDLNTY